MYVCGYMWVHRFWWVINGYTGLHVDTQGRLRRVTSGYTGLRWLHVDAQGYMRIHRVTCGYKGLIRCGYRGGYMWIQRGYTWLDNGM